MCIGQELDHAAAAAALDACLLTEKEMKGGETAWAKLPDAFAEAWESHEAAAGDADGPTGHGHEHAHAH